MPIGVFRWYFENSGFWGVFLGVFSGLQRGGGYFWGCFGGFWGVSWFFGVFHDFFGGKFLSLEKFRVKYRNIPIVAFRGRSIIVSAL